jgi:hypothetical protein
MKVSVNDQELFTLSDTQKQVIMNDLPEDIFDADMKRRLEWVLMHQYRRSFKALKSEWDHKLLANGVGMVPTDPDAYAQLVFAQPNYKNRSARDNQIEAQ